MERCPACNARLREADSCPRCKADLSDIISAEKTADLWLTKAIQFFQDNNYEPCISAIECSLRSKDSRTARVFREYLIDFHCRNILDLLAQKQFLLAKQLLYRTRYLLPHSKQMRHLSDFTDYLLVKESQAAIFMSGIPVIDSI